MSMDFLLAARFSPGRRFAFCTLATGFHACVRPEHRVTQAFLDSSQVVKSWPAHLPLSVVAASNIFRCAGAARVE